MDCVRIEKAGRADAAQILAVQYAAYAQEATLYGGVTLPPQRETVRDFTAIWDDYVILKAVVEGVIVGSVRGREEEGTCCIGRLSVRPDQQGRGLGRALLIALEQAFAAPRRFELFTGHKSHKNLDFYRRHGYREFRREAADEAVTLIFMEKWREDGGETGQ